MEKNEKDLNTLADERVDKIGFGDLRLIQKPDEFCYGIDAVLLADFAASSQTPNSKYKSIMDLGTGTGIVPIIMTYLTEASMLVGIEIQKNSFDIAERNAIINGLENRVTFINEDIRFFDKFAGDFDAVTVNPPYTINNNGIVNPNKAKAIARHEITGNLDEFIASAARVLRDKGDFFIVHRPARLVDICCSAREHGLEPKRIRFVSSKQGEIPNIILVHCVKNGGKELKILKPLNVYDSQGGYTEEILKIYKKNVEVN